MKRYWDHTEKERANLTQDQVTHLLDFELMEQGVPKVVKPELLPVEFPPMEKSKVWGIKQGTWRQSDVAYATSEEAAKAISGGMWLTTEYVGSEPVHTVSHEELSIVAIDIIDRKLLINLKSQNDLASANKKSNESAMKVYNEAIQAVDKVLEGLWEDYRDMQAKDRRYKAIIDTYAQYKSMCDGNGNTARKFLVKAFGADEVNAALKWFELVDDTAVEESTDELASV